MIYPKVSKDEWSRRYPVTSRVYRCPRCQNKFETTVPVLAKEFAGLATPVHECGTGYVSYVLTPTTAEGIGFWKKVAG